jgi:hypothetical protein
MGHYKDKIGLYGCASASIHQPAKVLALPSWFMSLLKVG